MTIRISTKPSPVDHRPRRAFKTRPATGSNVRPGDYLVVHGRAHRIDRVLPYDGPFKDMLPAGTRVAESCGGPRNGGAAFRLAPDQPVAIVTEFGGKGIR